MAFTTMAKDPNSNFMIRLGGGESELRILLSKKAESVVTQERSGPQLSSGANQQMMHRHTDDEDVYRKRRKGYLNFYDLGQIDDGGWVDLPFSALYDDTGGPLVANFAFTENEWHDLADLITSVPIADWKTTYRKLEYTAGELYGLDLTTISGGAIDYSIGRNASRKDGSGALIDGHDWSTKGLQIVPATFASEFNFQDWGAFYFLGSDPAYTKITTVYDPTATGVSFTLRSTANIYLMPRMVSTRAIRIGSTNAFGTEMWNLCAPYRAIPREFWLNRSNGSDFLPNIYSYNDLAITLDTTNSADLIAFLVADPLTRIFHTTWPSSTPSVAELGSDPGGWEMVKFESFTPYENDSRVGMYAVYDPTVSSYPITDGILIGVIEQGGTYYYFWRTTNGPNFVGLGGPVHDFTLT